MTVTHSKNVLLYGTGYYSWFYGPQQTAFQSVGNTNTHGLAINVYGMSYMLTGDDTIPASYTSSFCSTAILASPL